MTKFNGGGNWYDTDDYEKIRGAWYRITGHNAGDPVSPWLSGELERLSREEKGVDIDRSTYFLRDGYYYPIIDGEVDFRAHATGSCAKELAAYDDDPTQGQSGNDYLIQGKPPVPGTYGAKAPQVTHDSVARDVVSHYTTGEIETVDYIRDKLGYDGVMAYIIGNLIKYPSRGLHKGQLRSDLVKIRNYAVIALEMMDKEGIE